jgi:putative hydrolase of the HAD superfamily
MSYTTLFFDLDDTLYPSSNGLWSAIRERITSYMVERLQVPPQEVVELRRRYYEQYGTTLRGLQKHHVVDGHDFLTYVHDVPLSGFLTPNPELIALLRRLPQRKWIFTNADSAHARRVLEALQVSEFFEGIVDVVSNGFACKPEEQAYRSALLAAGESSPERCIFLDDSPRNLAPARRLGIFTILVGSDRANEAADRSILSLQDLPRELPELLEV